MHFLILCKKNATFLFFNCYFVNIEASLQYEVLHLFELFLGVVVVPVDFNFAAGVLIVFQLVLK